MENLAAPLPIEPGDEVDFADLLGFVNEKALDVQATGSINDLQLGFTQLFELVADRGSLLWFGDIVFRSPALKS